MIQYIDVGDIVHNLPESVNGNPFYTPRLEIDVCLLEGLTIESGGTRKLRTNIGICNIPDTHNVNFTGIKNSACIFTKDGVLKSSSYGYLYVYRRYLWGFEDVNDPRRTLLEPSFSILV